MLAVWHYTERDRHPRVELRPLLPDLLRLDWSVPGASTIAAMANAGLRRIGVGVLVTGNIYRHPAVLANMASTVDVISNGRLEPRRGGTGRKCEAYGITLPPLRERFDMFDDKASRCSSSCCPHHLRLRGALQLAGPRAVSKPSTAPRSASAEAGRSARSEPFTKFHAQHWNVPAGDVASFQRKRAVLGEHCEAIGRDLSGRDHHLDPHPLRPTQPGCIRGRRPRGRRRPRPRDHLPSAAPAGHARDDRRCVGVHR